MQADGVTVDCPFIYGLHKMIDTCKSVRVWYSLILKSLYV